MPLTDHSQLLTWRSLLFVPAHVQKFIESAPKRNADAIILDLEDSVPQGVKSKARQQLSEQVNYLNKQSLDVLIRINRDLINAVADLDAAVIRGVTAIVIPKVMGAEHIRLLDEVVTEWEVKRKLAPASIHFIGMIETIEALQSINAIAQASPRMAGLALGTEDLSLDGGFEATPENLTYPAQQLVYAARLADINAYGFPASIADYSDIELFARYQVKAKSMGFDGAFCIHPSQVNSINQAYTTTPEERAAAEKIVAAYEDASKNSRGAVEVDGKMVDAPVVERALKTLKRI